MTASLAGYLSSQTVYRCDRDGVSIKKKDLGTALNDLWDDLDEHFRNKGVRFQELLEAKQRRYYLRDTQTKKAVKPRIKRHQKKA